MTRTQKLVATAGLVAGVALTVVGTAVATVALGFLPALPAVALQTWVLIKGVEGIGQVWGVRAAGVE